MSKKDDLCVNKELFYQELDTYYDGHAKKKPWSTARCNEIIEILSKEEEASETGEKKSNEQYYYPRKYELIELDGKKTIIKKRTTENENITLIVPYEQIYDKLVESHSVTKHGGRDKMIANLKTYYSITRAAVQIFIWCCKKCTSKKRNKEKVEELKPIASKGRNEKGRVDVIHFQSTADDDFKWILIYEDHQTKFVHLRPLQSTQVEKVSLELLKIFLEFGAPKKLQSHIGRKFVRNIIQQLASKWPTCKIINGQHRNMWIPDNVETVHDDVVNMLRAWMKDNNSTDWSLGCYFVQYQKNSSCHRIIKSSPNKAVFGVDFSVPLPSCSNTPSETLAHLIKEEYLEESISEESTSNPDHSNGPEIKVEEVETCVSVDHIKIEEVDVELTHWEEYSDKFTENDSKQSELKFFSESCKEEKMIDTEKNGSVIGQKRPAEKMLANTKRKRSAKLL